MSYSSPPIPRLLLIVLLLIIIMPSSISAQEEMGSLRPVHTFRHYTVTDGLPDNFIHDIHQDQQGFIWVATADGVARFDGYHFVPHQSGDSEESGLINSNEINEIFEDSSGQLWFATRGGGVNLFDATTQTFSRYPDTSRFEPTMPEGFNEDRSTPPLPPGNGGNIRLDVLDLTIDQQGNHWWGGIPPLGLMFVDAETEEGEVIDPVLYAGRPPVFDLFTAVDGSIWIFAEGGVTRWADGEFTPYLTRDDADTFSNDIQQTAIQDQQGTIWFTFSGQFYRYDPSSDSVVEMATIEPRILSIAEDSAGLFWVGTNEGLYTYDAQTAEWEKFTADDPNLNPGLADQVIQVVFVDVEDNIWLGTNRGISVLPRRHLRFTNYSTRLPSSLSTLPNGSVTNIAGVDDVVAHCDGDVKLSRLILGRPTHPNELCPNRQPNLA